MGCERNDTQSRRLRLKGDKVCGLPFLVISKKTETSKIGAPLKAQKAQILIEMLSVAFGLRIFHNFQSGQKYPNGHLPSRKTLFLKESIKNNTTQIDRKNKKSRTVPKNPKMISLRLEKRLFGSWNTGITEVATLGEMKRNSEKAAHCQKKQCQGFANKIFTMAAFSGTAHHNYWQHEQAVQKWTLRTYSVAMTKKTSHCNSRAHSHKMSD